MSRLCFADTGIILATAGAVVSILNEVVLPYFPVSGNVGVFWYTYIPVSFHAYLYHSMHTCIIPCIPVSFPGALNAAGGFVFRCLPKEFINCTI